MFLKSRLLLRTKGWTLSLIGELSSKKLIFLTTALREDTHKKNVFFSGRTTKGVGRVSPLTTKQKTTFFSLKTGCFSPKIGKKKTKLSKSVSGISGFCKTKKINKKGYGPLSHECREGKTLVVRPLKNNLFFMCVFPYVLPLSSITMNNGLSRNYSRLFYCGCVTGVTRNNILLNI